MMLLALLACFALEDATGKLLDAHVSALDKDSGGFCGAVLVGCAICSKGFGRRGSPNRQADFRRVRPIAARDGDLETRRSRFFG